MSTKLAAVTSVLRATIVGDLHVALDSYLRLNLTKAQLTQRMLSYVIDNAVTSVVATGNDFVTLSDEVVQEASLQMFALRDAYTALYTLTLPVMNEATVRNMSYVQYMFDDVNGNETSNITSAEMMSFLDDPLAATLRQIETWYLSEFAGRVTTVREELNTLLTQLADSATNLEERLVEYDANSRMNYNFYTSVAK